MNPKKRKLNFFTQDLTKIKRNTYFCIFVKINFATFENKTDVDAKYSVRRLSMKKVIIFFVFIFCAGFVSGQDQIGIKAGVNSSYMYFYPTQPQQSVLGAQTGLVYIHCPEPNFGIQLELNYSQRGWKKLYMDTAYSSRYTNFLELGAYSHLAFGSGRLKIIFTAGLYGAAVVGARVEEMHYGTIVKSVYAYKDSADRRYEGGVGGGVGFSVDIGRGTILLEGRFTQGLTNTHAQNNNQTLLPDLSIYEVMSVSLTYFYNFGSFEKKEKTK